MLMSRTYWMRGLLGRVTTDWGWISGGDAYVESILLLQRAQESLENGMSEFSPSLSSFINSLLNNLFIQTNVACQLSIWTKKIGCSSSCCVCKKCKFKLILILDAWLIQVMLQLFWCFLFRFLEIPIVVIWTINNYCDVINDAGRKFLLLKKFYV
jgi:hypothetical protein